MRGQVGFFTHNVHIIVTPTQMHMRLCQGTWNRVSTRLSNHDGFLALIDKPRYHWCHMAPLQGCVFSEAEYVRVAAMMLGVCLRCPTSVYM